jgi:Putative Flp pilus-assembly TadE/G-like
LSSTIRREPSRNGEGGQVLVLFAGGVFALLIVAALAFDVGMMLLERRDEQNAADAAALAGARYIFEPDCVAPAWTCTEARAAAIAVAQANGFDDADPVEGVQVHIPALHGRYDTLPNFIEVQIDSQRPSIFGGVVGRATWPVGVFAVATNDQNLNFPFSMLALSETACKAIHVSGQGEVYAHGNVQSNSNGSDCPDSEGGNWGLSRTGGGEITIIADDATCRSAGEIQDSGSGTMTCSQVEDSFALPDPLRLLEAPDKPALAPSMERVGHTSAFPEYCPGRITPRPPSETQPKACELNDVAWLLHPGLYPNGLELKSNGTAYLLPGIYWIGGGGFQLSGGNNDRSSVISVASLAEAAAIHAKPTAAEKRTAWQTGGGGVLIYNSSLPSIPGDEISFGAGKGILLIKAFFDPVSDPPDPNEIYNNMSIFQDRTVTSTVKLNGTNADAEVAGIVYVPTGQVQINGSNSEFVVDQIIAGTFKINGSTGTIRITRRVGIDAQITAAGLVD